MIPASVRMSEVMSSSVDEIIQLLGTLTWNDQVGLMTEILVIDTTNEPWAQQDSVKTVLYKQVAQIVKKFKVGFLIDAFRDCNTVFAKNGKPALFPWVIVRWKDECARKRCVQAEEMKTPALTADEFAKLEELVHAQ